VGVFVQIWFDDEAHAEYGGQFRIEGAYAAITDILKPGFGLKIGKLPLTIGRFAERVYSDKNPLIGTPMMYGYRTDLPKNQQSILIDQPASYFPRTTATGLPVAYEACWDTGIEQYGAWRWFDYAIAVTKGVLADPRGAAKNDGVQWLARFGVRPDVSLNIGLNLGIGPYLVSVPQAVMDQQHKSVEDYHQKLWGFDLEYSRGSVTIFGEVARNTWDVLFEPGEMGVTTWYLEGKWKFAPAWYLAVRTGQMRFDKETFGANTSQPWDYNVTRIEGGIGYHFTRNITGKMVEQVNRFPDRLSQNIATTACQLSISF